MPEPIASNEPNQTYVDPDWNSEQTQPLTPAAPAPGPQSQNATESAPQTSAGTAQLLSEMEPIPSNYVTESGADNVDERRAETPMQLPYADAGITASRDSAYAEGALVFGESDGVELSAVQLSGQVGRQTEVNAALLNMSVTTPDGLTQAELASMELDLGLGVQTDAEGVEVAASAHATLLSVEIEQDLGSGNSLTVGAGLGVGMDGSVGTRDVDGDDHDEYCLRVSAFGMTAGGCLELGQLAQSGLDALVDTLTPD